MSSIKLYSIVIPVYNSSQSLIEISTKIDAVFLNIPTSDYEIIFIDDFSPKAQTWETLKALQLYNKKVKCLRLTRNFGQQAATICGMSHSIGDFIFTMDDDLQHPPEGILEFLKTPNHDAVIAQFNIKEHSFIKIILSNIKAYFDYIIIKKPKNIQLSSFRMINRKTCDAILAQANTPYPFISAMLFYATKDVIGIRVNHAKRLDGKSGYGTLKMLKLFSNLLINNSSLLLRLVGNIGMIIALFSFSLSIFFLIKKLFWGIKIAGWTSLIISILFIGGLNLFSLGLIGEYLIRIIKSTEKKPLYFVKDSFGFE